MDSLMDAQSATKEGSIRSILVSAPRFQDGGDVPLWGARVHSCTPRPVPELPPGLRFRQAALAPDLGARLVYSGGHSPPTRFRSTPCTPLTREFLEPSLAPTRSRSTLRSVEVNVTPTGGRTWPGSGTRRREEPDSHHEGPPTMLQLKSMPEVWCRCRQSSRWLPSLRTSY
jgi:hypothetical protein